MTTALQVDTDPAEVGVDAARLARLDRRLTRFVDDGQLPGFLVTVARHGRLVHVGRAGYRHVEDGLPVEPGTRWRIYSMTKPVGVGFGLGFSLVIDPVRYGVLASAGDYSWGGAASTAFYVDPVEDVTVGLYAQLLPSRTLPIRNHLRALVNQALVD